MPYFVVFLLQKKEYVAVPNVWVYDIDKHHEKFINNSINRSQKFTCFYPDASSSAFIDGQPDESYEPDFTTDCYDCKLRQFFECYADAEQKVNRLRNTEPKGYNKGRLNELPIPKVVAQRKQTVAAGNSNANSEATSSTDENDAELTDELAIPEPHDDSDTNDPDPLAVDQNGDVQPSSSNQFGADPPAETTNKVIDNGENDSDFLAPNNIDQNESSQLVFDGESEAESQIETDTATVDVTESTAPNNDANTNNVEHLNATQNENSQNANCLQIVAVESLAGFISNGNNQNTSSPNETLDDSHSIKPEIAPIYDYNYNSNEVEINNSLLAGSEGESSGDEIEMTVGSSGFPMPLRATTNDLIKRDGDPISGDIPFNETSKGRIYKFGGKRIEIPKKAVDKIIEWNIGSKRDDMQYDRKVCQSLLLSLVSKEELIECLVDDEVMKFIKACLIVRCNNQNVDNRIMLLNAYKDELCAMMWAKK